VAAGALDLLAGEDLAPVARAFHAAATRGQPPGQYLSAETRLALEIARGDNPRSTASDDSIALPQHPSERVGELWQVIRARRTVRQFGSRALTLQDLTDIMTLAAGVTDTVTAPKPLRAEPSGGALYPLSVYVATLRVDGLPLAVYRYHPLTQRLERLLSEASLEILAGAIHTDGQPSVETSSAVLLLTWSWTRSVWKYGERGYLLGLIEAGHIVQNALLAITQLGLAAAPTIGLDGDAVDEMLGLDSRLEQAIYAVVIGKVGEPPR
jgi:SagB-type dehydrogenase family enzyme